MARPRNILHNYFAVVESKHFTAAREFRAYAKDPISALNQIHGILQKKRELDAKRKVVRPRLKPDEYKLLRLFQKYDDACGNPIEADLDLPQTANPCVLPRKRIKTVNLSFGFAQEKA